MKLYPQAAEWARKPPSTSPHGCPPPALGQASEPASAYSPLSCCSAQHHRDTSVSSRTFQCSLTLRMKLTLGTSTRLLLPEGTRCADSSFHCLCTLRREVSTCHSHGVVSGSRDPLGGEGVVKATVGVAPTGPTPCSCPLNRARVCLKAQGRQPHRLDMEEGPRRRPGGGDIESTGNHLQSYLWTPSPAPRPMWNRR